MAGAGPDSADDSQSAPAMGPATPSGEEPRRVDARERVLSTLSRLGAVSRADLARRTALAPSTVSSVVADLLHAGLVVEVGGPVRAGTRGGRPATLLALHRRAGVAIGIDFGKRHVRVALADLAHELLSERSAPVSIDWAATEGIRCAVTLVDDVLAEARAARANVIGVGVGLPGPVRADTGELGEPTILPGWVGLRAPQAVAEELGLPARVDNDANLGALGEWMWGAARGCSDVVYLKVATGIGAGLLIGGRPFRGVGGTAGEIGHFVIDPGGPLCRCGNRGCLEILAGADAVLRALRPAHGDQITLEDAIAYATDGDGSCRRALADAGRVIGIAVAAVCNLINPERIVVGGELGAAGELLIAPLRESLRRSAIRSAAEDVGVVQGALGDRAEVLGAVALAIRSGNPRTGPAPRRGSAG